MNIFLTGFMGAGKSTTGKLLAERLGRPFSDLDLLIVQREKRSIADIFATDGELYFRDCETSLLQELPPLPATIYATGGGIVEREDNRRMMRALGRVIYLKTGWDALQKRLASSEDRPLVDPVKGWAKVKDLWLRRQSFYTEADLVVNTDGFTPLQVADRIVAELTS